MITLIGPGGAGKSTVGALVADRLGVSFLDLDRCFTLRLGDISEYIKQFGYQAYARENVTTYRSVMANRGSACVMALSSGFMTYPRTVDPEYSRLRDAIEHRATSFVLLPSLDHDVCVAETVRRQLGRPFARSAAQEEVVIRERFVTYIGLRATTIATMGPLAAVVDALLTAIRGRVVARDERPV